MKELMFTNWFEKLHVIGKIWHWHSGVYRRWDTILVLARKIILLYLTNIFFAWLEA